MRHYTSKIFKLLTAPLSLNKHEKKWIEERGTSLRALAQSLCDQSQLESQFSGFSFTEPLSPLPFKDMSQD